MNPLTLTLEMPPETAAVLAKDEGALESAQAFVIDSPAMADLANDELRGVKARIKRIKELKEGFVEPARQILENAAALFNPALNALTLAEAALKLSLSTWTTEQERIAAEERQRQQAAQRLREQEAERAAAAERARAQELARAEERRAAEAEAARVKALAEGNAREAAKQAALAASATEKAQSVVENADAKAMDALVAAQIPVAAPVVAPAKVSGFSMRDNWKAELLPGVSPEQALALIVKAAATNRPDLLSLLTVDMTAAYRLAKAQHNLMNVPGMKAVNRPVASSRAA